MPIYAAALQRAEQLFVSAVNVHETGTVLRIRRGPAAVARMWRFLQEENDSEIAPFDRGQAEGSAQFEISPGGRAYRGRLRLAPSGFDSLGRHQSISIPGLLKHRLGRDRTIEIRPVVSAVRQCETRVTRVEGRRYV